MNVEETSSVIPQSSESTLPEATFLHEARSIIPWVSNMDYQESKDKDTSKTLSLINVAALSASVPDSTTDRSLDIPDQDYHEQSFGSNLTPTEKDLPENMTAKSSNAYAIKTDVYYSILAVEQDDIIYLHHKDIVSHTCSVKVDKLTEKDVHLAHDALCQPTRLMDKPSGEPIAESTIKDRNLDPDWPVKKQKKRST